MIFLRKCPGCGVALRNSSGGSGPCRSCRAGLIPVSTAGLLAVSCGLDSLEVGWDFAGVGRSVVMALKRRGSWWWLPWAAARLCPAPNSVDVLAWVPTTRRRRRLRGADQAELLARACARRLGLVAAAALVPPRRAQHGGTRHDRLRRAPYRVRRRAAVAGLRVLLVDDVVTTGASMRAAAAALRAAGATEVHGVVLARAARLGSVTAQPAMGWITQRR